MTSKDRFSRVRFVLLRPRFAQNVGAAARALHNFGTGRLVLAELDEGHLDEAEARRTAVRSEHLLEAAPRVPSLEAAVEGCAYVVGTTGRPPPGRPVLPPREAAERLLERGRTQDVALVFGGERTGLTHRELLLCHELSVIPTAALPSLNLAQAVLLYAWTLAGVVDDGLPAPTTRADEAQYAQIEAALRRHLEAVAFCDPDRPGHGVLDLIQTLKRAGLTPAEARLWQAVLHARARPGRGA